LTTYCSECGTKLREGARFCPNCRSQVSPQKVEPLVQVEDDDVTRLTSRPVLKKTPATISVRFVVLASVCGILIGAVLIVLAEFYGSKQRQVEANRAVRQPTPTPRPTPTPMPSPTPRPPRKLVPESFSVESGQYYSAQFNVGEEGGRVAGSYRSDSNIVAMIVSGEGLARIDKGDDLRSKDTYYYSGGKVASGQIDVELAPGTYYIVFSNQYSFLSTKKITANITLED
jgi:hypothetical protein